MRQSVESFFSELLAVVLGIVITFAVQGMIDRAHDRNEVRQALQLVRTELVNNREDINDLKAFLNQEMESAQFLSENAALVKDLDRLDSLTAAPVKYHLGYVGADVYIVFPHDALELLKMSSIFQKIGDNALSMKIIRAYDCCSSMTTSIDSHIKARNSQPYDRVADWILLHDPRIYADDTDVDKAITAINVFLRQK